MSTWTPTVPLITDGVDPVSGTTLNPIILTLASRDQFLLDRIGSYEDKSVLMAYDVAVDTDTHTAVEQWDIVYFNAQEAELEKAVAGFSNSVDPSHLVPAASAYVFGMVQHTNGNGTADVFLQGVIPGVPLVDILDIDLSNEDIKNSTPTFGPLYLSFAVPGKLTFNPSGASIFVGYYMGLTDGSTGNLLLSPNIDSLNQLYFNYKLYLWPTLAGSATLSADAWTITTSDFTKVGWVDADDANAQYGYIVPTNVGGTKVAAYFYNVPLTSIVTTNAQGLTSQQIKDALLLKEALPPYPAAYSMLFNNGVLQTQYDADHTTGVYIINGEGIWWCDATNGNTPWQTGTAPALNLLLQTTKLNPFYKSSIVTSLAPYVSANNNDTSRAITFIDKESGTPASTGDLLLKLNLPVITTATTTGTPTAIQSVTFTPSIGSLTVQTGPNVSGVVGGAGLLTSTDAHGVVTISISNYTLSGSVEDIEPEESDYVYKGLHSYLRIKAPVANQRIGFVGKVLLPQYVPAAKSFKVKLLAFGDATGSTNIPVPFNFEYVISCVGTSQISNAINTGTYKGNSSIGISGFTQNIVQTVGYDNTNTPYFEIPASALTINGSNATYVNFRVARVYSSSVYNGNINVIGTTWEIT